MGAFGNKDAGEDHRFLIDLRNVSLSPVPIRVAASPRGSSSRTSVTTIQRSAEPGQDLVSKPCSTRLCWSKRPAAATSPSDGSPRRRVSWDGAELQCLGW